MEEKEGERKLSESVCDMKMAAMESICSPLNPMFEKCIILGCIILSLSLFSLSCPLPFLVEGQKSGIKPPPAHSCDKNGRKQRERRRKCGMDSTLNPYEKERREEERFLNSRPLASNSRRIVKEKEIEGERNSE